MSGTKKLYLFYVDGVVTVIYRDSVNDIKTSIMDCIVLVYRNITMVYPELRD